MPTRIELYQEMADLTRPKCGECRVPHSCCDPDYCNIAAIEASYVGIRLPETGHPILKYMGPDGCTVPPYLRPMCTLHVCSINGFGVDADLEFTKKYFRLRRDINLATT